MRRFAGGCLVVVLGLLIAGYLGAWHPAGDSFAVFRPTLAWGALGLALIASGRWQLRVAAGALAGAVLVLTYGARLQTPPSVEADLILYQQNLLWNRDDPAGFADILVASDADVITLQELSVRNRPLLAALADTYPYRSFCPYGAVGGVAVLSRLPVVPGSRECAGNDGMAAMQIETEAGPLWVVALHLHWPWPYRQATQIAGLAPFLEVMDGPVLLAGDFNSVRWSHAVEVVAQATGTRHRGPFEPTFYTWPHGYPLGIDHVLASPQMRVRVDVVGPEGSDHNGVLARIDLP